MPELSRREFFELGFLYFSAACTGGLISNGCAALGREYKKEYRIGELDFEPVEIKLIPFQKYRPDISRENITIEDKLLEKYLKEPYTLTEMFLLIAGEDKGNNTIRRVDISNYGRFKAEILAAAKRLKISEEEIENLSIHDAILLSGKIVAEKLEYHPTMLGREIEDLPKDPEELLKILTDDALTGKSRKSEEAKKIDAKPKDQLFFDGTGICKNYSSVNAAVFKVLKDMNANLNNTFMRWYFPEEIRHTLIVRHTWNQIATVKRSANNLEILITYVDPTWLDTKKGAVLDAGGKAIYNEKDINDTYNALDEAHFEKEIVLARAYAAKLYEVLGDNARTITTFFRASKNYTYLYLDKAFRQRVEVCHKFLDFAEKNPKDFDWIKYFLWDSFKKSIEDMSGLRAELYFMGGSTLLRENIFLREKNSEQLEEIENVYERASKILPKYVKEKKIDFDKTFSMEELFDKVKELYSE